MAGSPPCRMLQEGSGCVTAGFSPLVGGQPLRAEPCCGSPLRGPREPGVLDDLGEFIAAHLSEPAGTQKHRQVAFEMRRGEEGRGRIQDKGILFDLGRDPEDDHVVVTLAGFRIERVWAGVADRVRRLRDARVARRAFLPWANTPSMGDGWNRNQDGIAHWGYGSRS